MGLNMFILVRAVRTVFRHKLANIIFLDIELFYIHTINIGMQIIKFSTF